MIHLGDITKINFAPPVNCITFGSPCQDLSIAGKRAGLAGNRSGLFMDAVRVIKNMYLATMGMYPQFAVWENVPGAFSSNKGEDFRAVLEELARIKEPEVSIPRPENGKWAKAGFIAGNGWSIAWRTFDAQFWGVPQRRRRIALVLDLRGQRAGEILFERTGVSGNPEPSIPAWKGIARNPADRSAGHDRVVEKQTAGGNQVTACLYAAYGTKWNGNGGAYSGDNFVMEPNKECLTPWDVQSRRIYMESGKWPAIYAGEGVARNPESHVAGHDRVVETAIPINTQIATRHISLGERTGMGWGEDGDPAYTLQAGHEHAVCCLLNDQGGQSIQVEDGQVSPTLRAESHAHEPVVMCRAHGQANAETLEECCPTLNCNHEQPIVFESHSQDARYTQQGDTSTACTAQWGTGGNNMPIVAERSLTPWDFQSRRIFQRTVHTPCYKPEKQGVLIKRALRWIVRRLTPTECERLQGFPDGWTDIGDWTDSKGKRHKAADSPRYKALGNSIALPQWWWITCKMAQYLPEHATLGSLFDGIGGFPLVWETKHGKGTAVWASEIEEFPIAITKKHFGGTRQ